MNSLPTPPKNTRWCKPHCQKNKPCGQPDCKNYARSAKRRSEESDNTKKVCGDGGAKEGDAHVVQKSILESIHEGHIIPRTLHLGEFYAVFTGESRGVYTAQKYEEDKIRVSDASQVQKYFIYEEALAAYEAFEAGLNWARAGAGARTEAEAESISGEHPRPSKSRRLNTNTKNASQPTQASAPSFSANVAPHSHL
ncbi:uncharacterized protein [Typha angustifolia]|uniref:uncharacterized protein n=1 Tax=Typha angustifolia TaxID=59011 RepID=UPI003C2F9892